MKYRLIALGLNAIAKRMDGHKTRIGAITKVLAGVQVALAALVEVLALMFPESGAPSVNREVVGALAGVTYALGSGLQGIGSAHKHEKEEAILKEIAAQASTPSGTQSYDLNMGRPYDGA